MSFPLLPHCNPGLVDRSILTVESARLACQTSFVQPHTTWSPQPQPDLYGNRWVKAFVQLAAVGLELTAYLSGISKNILSEKQRSNT